MKKMIVLVLFLSGCTMHYKTPEKEVDLTNVDITVCELGFLRTGWTCAEIRNDPKLVHPFIVTYLGCGVKYFSENGLVKGVIFSDFDRILEHEIDHFRGYDDGSERFHSVDTKESNRIQNIIDDKLNKYGDKCYQWKEKK